MAQAQDFQQLDGDLKIANGDFMIGDADADHVEDIISSSQGEWKEFPLVGVSIDQYLNSAGQENEISRQVRLQLSGDGYSQLGVITTRNVDGTFDIKVDATREL